MEKAERSQVKKYFAPFPKWAVGAIAFGAILLALSAEIGLVAIVAGIAAIVFWTQKPTDQQIDALIKEDLGKIEKLALDKTGLDESEIIAEPVMVYGPRFWNIGGADAGIKKGSDGIVRFMPLGVTVINFTPNQLTAYQCALDLTTGNALSESTDEYFYRDVVSVSTQSKSLTWDSAMLNMKKIASGPLAALMVAGKLQLNAAETFVLTTSGGTSIEVVLRDQQLIKSAGGGNIPTDMANKAVQSVRKMLREKKTA